MGFFSRLFQPRADGLQAPSDWTRLPDTDASGQVVKKPKKPKKPKASGGGGGKRNLGKWVDSGEVVPSEPSIKPVRKVPVFNTGPRKKK